MAGTCKCGNEPSGSIECREFDWGRVSFSSRTLLHGVSKRFARLELTPDGFDQGVRAGRAVSNLTVSRWITGLGSMSRLSCQCEGWVSNITAAYVVWLSSHGRTVWTKNVARARCFATKLPKSPRRMAPPFCFVVAQCVLIAATNCGCLTEERSSLYGPP